MEQVEIAIEQGVDDDGNPVLFVSNLNLEGNDGNQLVAADGTVLGQDEVNELVSQAINKRKTEDESRDESVTYITSPLDVSALQSESLSSQDALAAVAQSLQDGTFGQMIEAQDEFGQTIQIRLAESVEQVGELENNSEQQGNTITDMSAEYQQQMTSGSPLGISSEGQPEESQLPPVSLPDLSVSSESPPNENLAKDVNITENPQSEIPEPEPDLDNPIKLSDETIVTVGGKKCVLRVNPDSGELCAYPINKKQGEPMRFRIKDEYLGTLPILQVLFSNEVKLEDQKEDEDVTTEETVWETDWTEAAISTLVETVEHYLKVFQSRHFYLEQCWEIVSRKIKLLGMNYDRTSCQLQWIELQVQARNRRKGDEQDAESQVIFAMINKLSLEMERFLEFDTLEIDVDIDDILFSETHAYEWTDEATEGFIQLFKDRADEFFIMDLQLKCKFWVDIANKMHELDFPVTADQCAEHWESLFDHYRSSWKQDLNPVNVKYYTDVADILNRIPRSGELQIKHSKYWTQEDNVHFLQVLLEKNRFDLYVAQKMRVGQFWDKVSAELGKRNVAFNGNQLRQRWRHLTKQFHDAEEAGISLTVPGFDLLKALILRQRMILSGEITVEGNEVPDSDDEDEFIQGHTKWTSPMIKILIKVYKEFLHLFKSVAYKSSQVWDLIAHHLEKHHNVMTCGLSCRHKWKKLERRFIGVSHLPVDIRCKRVPYYKEMAYIMGANSSEEAARIGALADSLVMGDPGSKSNFIWSYDCTVLFLNLAKKYWKELRDPSLKRFDAFRCICLDMMGKGYDPTADMCDSKWRNMRKAFKKYGKDFQFHEIMKPMMEDEAGFDCDRLGGGYVRRVKSNLTLKIAQSAVVAKDKVWEEEEVLLLIELYKSYSLLLSTNPTVWEDISVHMNKHGWKTTQDECVDKFMVLKRTYELQGSDHPQYDLLHTVFEKSQEEDTKKAWTIDGIDFLIERYIYHRKHFLETMSGKEIWNSIANDFKARDVSYKSLECEKKWKILKHQFLRLGENFAFFEVMKDAVDIKPKVVRARDSKIFFKPGEKGQTLDIADALELLNEIRNEYDNDSKNRLIPNKQWTAEETTLFLELYTKLCNLFKSPLMKKYEVWYLIAEELRRHGYVVSSDNCDVKWRNMKKQFYRAKTNYSYYEEMKGLLVDSPGNTIWTKEQTECLIQAYAKNKHLFSNKLWSKQKVWEAIYRHLAENLVIFTPDQIRNKWKNLKSAYSKSGKASPFYAQLHPLFQSSEEDMTRDEDGLQDHSEILEEYLKYVDHEDKYSSVPRFTWTAGGVNKIITLYTEEAKNFQNPIYKKIELWIRISRKLCTRGIDVTPAICMNKWDQLKKEFRKMKPDAPLYNQLMPLMTIEAKTVEVQWTSEAISKMIEIYKLFKETVYFYTTSTRLLWKKISDNLRLNGFYHSAARCKRKWEDLIELFREHEIAQGQKENDVLEEEPEPPFPFYKEMLEVVDEDGTIGEDYDSPVVSDDEDGTKTERVLIYITKKPDENRWPNHKTKCFLDILVDTVADAESVEDIGALLPGVAIKMKAASYGNINNQILLEKWESLIYKLLEIEDFNKKNLDMYKVCPFGSILRQLNKVITLPEKLSGIDSNANQDNFIYHDPRAWEGDFDVAWPPAATAHLIQSFRNQMRLPPSQRLMETLTKHMHEANFEYTEEQVAAKWAKLRKTLKSIYADPTDEAKEEFVYFEDMAEIYRPGIKMEKQLVLREGPEDSEDEENAENGKIEKGKKKFPNFKWDESSTRVLIHAYRRVMSQKGDAVWSKHIWTKVSKEIQEDGYHVSATQAGDRWRKLVWKMRNNESFPLCTLIAKVYNEVRTGMQSDTDDFDSDTEIIENTAWKGRKPGSAWDEDGIKSLLEELHSELSTGAKRTTLWVNVSNRMKKGKKRGFSGPQCRMKWRNLCKNVENDKKDSPFESWVKLIKREMKEEKCGPLDWTTIRVRTLIQEFKKVSLNLIDYTDNDSRQEVWRLITNQLNDSTGSQFRPKSCIEQWYSLLTDYTKRLEDPSNKEDEFLYFEDLKDCVIDVISVNDLSKYSTQDLTLFENETEAEAGGETDDGFNLMEVDMNEVMSAAEVSTSDILGGTKRAASEEPEDAPATKLPHIEETTEEQEEETQPEVVTLTIQEYLAMKKSEEENLLQQIMSSTDSEVTAELIKEMEDVQNQRMAFLKSYQSTMNNINEDK